MRLTSFLFPHESPAQNIASNSIAATRWLKTAGLPWANRAQKARTTTTLFLADNKGQALACATPQAGDHHDSFRLSISFEELCILLEAAGIAVAGLFLKADSTFYTN